MSILERLTPDQKNTLVSLPYRAGLWISQSDSSGGEEAEREELQALSNIIHAFAEEMFGSENMQRIISATLTNKDQWPRWAENVKSVPTDCRLAIDVIAEYGDPKDVNVFRTHIMEIAEAVALAFQESYPESLIGRLKAYLAWRSSLRKKIISVQSFEEFLRISDSERNALYTLAQALKAA